MQPALEGEVLGDRQRGTRREQPLHRGVVGEVQEEHGALERCSPRQTARRKKLASRWVTPIAAKTTTNSSPSVAAGHAGLRGDLRGQLGGGQAEAREDRQLLAAHERVEAVDRRDARLDELGGVIASDGVDRLPVDVTVGLGLERRPAVDRSARTVEDAPDEVDADGRPRDLAAVRARSCRGG